MILRNLICLVLLSTVSIVASAQCKPIADACEHNIPSSYIPDGQFHYAMLKDEETATFGMTFFGGTTYRVAGCSGTTDGNLFFTLYDQDGNELFSNRDHAAAPYWDFVFASTMDVVVEANLDNEKASSGCAVVMVGFKK